MFSIATNFDPDILETISSEKVYEVCGKLPRDLIGGERPSFILPSINIKKLSKYIDEAHKKGIQFNYLLNAPPLQNIEYTQKGKNKIYKFLNNLIDIKIDSFTISIPYLAQFIKKHFSNVKVVVSVIADVDNLNKVKQWENIGVDHITLATDLNRDFNTLRTIRKKSSVKLKLLVNEGCLLSCIIRNYHHNIASISSSNRHNAIANIIDYCTITCRSSYFADISNFIRAPWIRPEDVHYYRNIGIDYFKIIGRDSTVPIV